ncbi:flagellar protein FliT [Modicisalibacter ilicicola]|uniref:flagellar protein FliT n=1 Tax=Modicisalibacter ilicicola TaxID=480814 RepID=UPI001FE6A773|nr:flagellar protein FliT [Halomonas ilicicola]
MLKRSARMLNSAREGEWAHLVHEESTYVIEVEDLRQLEIHCELDADAMRRKADLLERILEQDTETRQRLENRRNELSELMGNSRRRRELSRTYQAPDIARARQGVR